jgi:hypothetical protein
VILAQFTSVHLERAVREGVPLSIVDRAKDGRQLRTRLGRVGVLRSKQLGSDCFRLIEVLLRSVQLPKARA